MQIDNGYGQLVLDACSIVEGGVLVFFSSYANLQYYNNLWTERKYINAIK